MNLKALLEETLNTDAVSIQELQNINNNILIYLKQHDDMSDKVKKTFISSLTQMLLRVAIKIPGQDKYERFIAKLAASKNKIDVLAKILQYNNRLIKEKSNEKFQTAND